MRPGAVRWTSRCVSSSSCRRQRSRAYLASITSTSPEPIHSFIHSIIHSLMHSFIHSFIHSFGSLLINSMCTQTWACRHMSTACAFTRGGSSQRDGAFERGMPSRTFLGFMCHASAHMNSPCAMSHGGFSVMSSLSAMSHDGCAKPVPV